MITTLTLIGEGDRGMDVRALVLRTKAHIILIRSVDDASEEEEEEMAYRMSSPVRSERPRR